MSNRRSELAMVKQAVLSQTLRLGPQQTRVVCVELCSTNDNDVINQVGMVSLMSLYWPMITVTLWKDTGQGSGHG